MVVTSEKTIDEKYKQQGYKILRKGYPDRIYFKIDENNKIISDSLIFVEIKCGKNKLTYEQQVMKKIIKEILILPYKLEYVKKTISSS